MSDFESESQIFTPETLEAARQFERRRIAEVVLPKLLENISPPIAALGVHPDEVADVVKQTVARALNYADEVLVQTGNRVMR